MAVPTSGSVPGARAIREITCRARSERIPPGLRPPVCGFALRPMEGLRLKSNSGQAAVVERSLQSKDPVLSTPVAVAAVAVASARRLRLRPMQPTRRPQRSEPSETRFLLPEANSRVVAARAVGGKAEAARPASVAYPRRPQLTTQPSPLTPNLKTMARWPGSWAAVAAV